jgi:hypothetical protein
MLAAADKADATTRRYFALIFGAVALPFLFKVSRNIAIPLRFEDALIVLRYARNLAEGHGFVYNLGERILGVTTPLHTLISALWAWSSPEHAPAIQNVVGVFFLVLEAWLAARIVQRSHTSILAALVAVLLLTNLNFNRWGRRKTSSRRPGTSSSSSAITRTTSPRWPASMARTKSRGARRRGSSRRCALPERGA